ncbi:3-phosphoserine/phosphohydroxythreonine transaminase [candidate division CSSED10-310 bacterium]|uniref:Phosphoserine aminotransferase n=1 Tax=candidate division CSSED10-310 bacterium TaxID=2855610 RepID=A0ABV6Z1C1_UNCC1
MMARLFNFNPGPAALPLEALEKLQANIVEYKDAGMSILEMSHRSPEYSEIHAQTKERLRSIFGIPDNFEILFLGGGATLQFGMIPMNFLDGDKTADYIITGSWSKKAYNDAKLFGKANVAASSAEENFSRIPTQDELNLSENAVYVHLTSNNTIAGTQWKTFPDTGSVPIIADMSSDILSKRIDFSKFGVIYAGAQKNLGPAGVTLVIMRKDVLDKAKDGLPAYLSYKTHAPKDSLYNTPPVFGIYVMYLVLEWIEGQGGLAAVEKVNEAKGQLLYGAMDEDPEFFRGTVEKESRSLMNVTIRLPSEELEKTFIAQAREAGLHGLKGHRSVGGIRVSMYNASPLAGIDKLVDFMKDFRKQN